MYNLARAYDSIKRWDEALEIEERLLEVDKRIYGERSEIALVALTNILNTYLRKGDFDKAKEISVKVVELKEALGPKSPSTALSMYSLTALYYHRGIYNRTLVLAHQAEAIQRDQMGVPGPYYSEAIKMIEDI
ncbi:hypothetical protein PIIN_10572 [Serendipita indica DSM 11827]|uniref:Kinesin light chain n=1 Tax=Serendipita indica (strain DSM 11827) TaxID=1109443 RepID=G4TZ37_SERID|nr:hypothetical protein PIIN_10572 [Serendipita indica DSM 11827]